MNPLGFLKKTFTIDASRVLCEDPSCQADTHSQELGLGGVWKLRVVIRHAKRDALVQLWKDTEVVGDVVGLQLERPIRKLAGEAARQVLERVLGGRRFPGAGSSPDDRLGRVRRGLDHTIQSLRIATGPTTRPEERHARVRDAVETLEQLLVDVTAEELGLDVESIR